MGLGAPPTLSRSKATAGSKGKTKKMASSGGGKKKKTSKIGRGDETDFPELLPTVASSKGLLRLYGF